MGKLIAIWGFHSCRLENEFRSSDRELNHCLDALVRDTENTEEARILTRRLRY